MHVFAKRNATKQEVQEATVAPRVRRKRETDLAENSHPGPFHHAHAGETRREIRRQIKNQERAGADRFQQRKFLRRRLPDSDDLAPRSRGHGREKTTSLARDSNLVIHAVSVRAR